MENNQIDYSKIASYMLNASELVGKDAIDSYIPASIERLYRWFIQCDQGNRPMEGYVEGMRVVRLRRGLPKYFLNYLASTNGCNESDDARPYSRTILSGMYMVVPCVVFSKEMVQTVLAKRLGKFTIYELPDYLKGIYSETTFHLNDDGTAMCLKKSDLTDWIYTGSHYQALELSYNLD